MKASFKMPQNQLSASFSMGGGLDPRKYATKEELQEETNSRISGDNQLETSINEINNTIGNYGDIVTHDTDEFATASQGALANTALQPNDNISLLNNDLGFVASTDLATVATSGDYDDLSNKPTIPTKVSDLTNDSGFITNTVNNLTNYYLKSETYTKTEVQQLIASIPKFTVVVVQALPVTGQPMTLYLLAKDGEAPDVYEEYIWVTETSRFELLGSTAVDLDGYATENWVEAKGYATETFVTNGLSTKQNTLTAGQNININGNTISATDTIYTAGNGIDITNNVISNTQTSAEWGNIDGDITEQTDLIELLDTKQDLLTSENAGDNISILNGEGGQETVSGNGTIVLEKAMADGLNSVTVSGGLKRSLLPDGYTQYDYITATGTQYFVTDYYPNDKTEIETKTFLFKQPNAPMVTRWTGSPTNDTFGFYMGNVSGRLTFFFGTYSDSKYLNVENVKINIEHDIYMGVSSIKLDGTSYPITRGTFTSTQPIYIGAFNQTGTSIAGTLAGRIYPVKFIENGQVIRYYIPCANENNVIGLYEVVTGTFLANAGTGTLKKGRPYIGIDTIPSDYTRLDFLQATGTQYIDSGVVANFATNKIEQTATVQYTTSNASRELMGTNGYGFWGKNASNKIEAALGNVTVNDNALTKNVISWTTNPDGNKLILNVNNNQYTSTASDFVDADYAYYIFALGIRIDSSATASFLCHAKVWDYTIAVDDEVVCYLIPVRRNSDNVLGMYNVATGAFRTNAGTGTFTAGADVATPSPTNPIPIVCNNGQLKYSSNLFNQSLFNTDVGITVTYYTFSIDNGTYTMSTNIPYASGSLANVFLFAGQVTSGASTANNGVTSNTPRTITVTNGKYTVAFRSRVSAGDTAYNPKNYNWMLAKSSTAQSYQPYGEVYADGITETITDSANNTATAEILLALDTYKDTQELLSGVVTRNIGIKVLNGTEDWGAYAANNGYRSYRVNNFLDADTRNGICTHLPYYNFSSSAMDRECVAIGSNKTTLYINLAGEERTVNDFKTWLAQQYANGTPVIIVYPLATETTETVTGQTLTTITGDNTLTISQANIDNLPIEANFDEQGGLLISFVNTNYATETWVENKGYALTSQLPTNTSDLTNDSGFVVNTATGSNSLTIFGTAATTSGAINIGNSATASSSGYSVAIGYSTKGSGGSSVALGRGANSSGNTSVAIGRDAVSSGAFSIQLGKGTNSTASTLAVGFNGTNYQLLDGATGLIPDARISTSFAKTADLATNVTTNQLTIGNTTLSEAQLQALLSLI